MTDYGPGPCETCGEDLEGHTSRQLKKCVKNPPKNVDYNQDPNWKTTPRNGRTIVQAMYEELWKELDTIVDHIMSEGEPFFTSADRAVEVADAIKEYGEWRGEAKGIAYALAVLTNPYQPSVDEIRAEAMERWERGQEDGDD